MIQSVINFLDPLYPLQDPLKETLRANLFWEKHPKGHFLLKEGEVSNYIYFIVKGLVRAYYKNDEKELTAWIMKEEDVIISISSFWSRQPSEENIETLEETEVVYLHHDKLEEIYSNHIEFNVVGRLLTQKYYQQWNKHIIDMRMQSASQRYWNFITQYPDLANRITQIQLASFLGMDHTTLSKVRAKN